MFFFYFFTNLKKIRPQKKFAALRAAFSENNTKLKLFIVKIDVFSLLARRRCENFGFFTHSKQNFHIFRDFLKKNRLSTFSDFSQPKKF